MNRRPTQNGSSLYHRGTGPHTAEGSAATPAPSTSGTRVTDTGTGAASEDEGEESDATQGAPGRPTGAAWTVTGSGRPTDGTSIPGGGSATTGGTSGVTGGAAAANRTRTSLSSPETASNGSGGKSSSRNKLTGAAGASEHPTA
ncbi:uncharacterized protein [Procambarus clarkii]|uniref:uncharacterized protein n=1 Tax=Procambarus clarkii TaxID=6728 RepID=UPI00374388A9